MFYKTQIISLVVITFFASLAFASDTGQLYAGMYPDDFWRNTEILDSVASWAGNPMTFNGTFLDASEDPSNIMEKLEQAWAAKSTPFAKIEVSRNTASVATGTLAAEIMNLAMSLKAWLDKGESRTVIIAPMQEMNLQESRWGCDAANFPIAYKKFVTAFQQGVVLNK